MKINKYLTTTIDMSLQYDEKVSTLDDNGTVRGAKVQFKEILGIGISYSF
jgi:hypothetical protein